MQHLPKTKIVATIGPSTWEDSVLVEMINNGFSVARINASFADDKEIERVATQIRKLSSKVTLVLDTMGHKIRVTGFEEDRTLIKGERIILISEGTKVADAEVEEIIEVTYPTLEKDLAVGITILLDDGNLSLKVKEIKDKKVICEVETGGTLKKRKTVNIPGVHLNFPSLSEKDRSDIRSGIKYGYDMICASFVRTVEDVRLFREEMGSSDCKLIAKIEDLEGVKNFDKILEEVDGIMVARGDLGVELPVEQVPLIQKKFVYKCRMAGKPVIVATQMLESMRNSPRPTRAEVNDVANAVMDGVDAVMLSAETSTGKYPVEAVKMMNRIATEAERYLKPQIVSGRTDASKETDVLCSHLFSIASEAELSGVVVVTKSGRTVASLARHRPDIPIWCVSNNPRLVRQLQLYRGVTAFYISDFKKDRDELLKQAVDLVFSSGELDINSKVGVITGSTLLGKHTNTIFEIVDVKSVIK